MNSKKWWEQTSNHHSLGHRSKTAVQIDNISLFTDLLESDELRDVDPHEILKVFVSLVICGAPPTLKMVKPEDVLHHIYLNPDVRSELSASIKNGLLEFSKSSMYCHRVACFKGADKVIDYILHHANDMQVVYLPHRDLDELFADMLAGKTPISPKILAAAVLNQEVQLQTLKKLHREKSRLVEAVSDKMLSVSENLYPDSMNAGGDESADQVLLLLYVLLGTDANVALGLCRESATVDAAREFLEDDGILDCMARDPLFWYQALFLILEAGHGVADENLDTEFSELMDYLFRSPAKIGRMKCSRKYDKVKSSLKHFVSPVLCDLDLEERGVYLSDFETQRGPAQFNLRAYLLVSMINENRNEGLSAKQKRAVRRILEELIIPARHAIMERLEKVQCHDEIMAGAQTLTGWLQEIDAASEDEMPEEDLHDDTPEVLDEPEQRVWRYVDNPGCDLNAYTEWHFLSGTELDVHFRKHHVRPSIKAESIIRAIDYYLGMEPSQKNIMIKEHVGHESWHKLKRGGMRILIRDDDDRNIYVHVYPRKEWTYKAA